MLIWLTIASLTYSKSDNGLKNYSKIEGTDLHVFFCAKKQTSLTDLMAFILLFSTFFECYQQKNWDSNEVDIFWENCSKDFD